jgi:DnaK suppressor protein
MAERRGQQSITGLGGIMRAAGGSRIQPRESQHNNLSERTRALAEILRERRRGIQKELERLFSRLREEERPATGDNGDHAIYGFDREIGSARLGQLTHFRRQIDDALARHTEGRYGWCAACDMKIPVARLRSLPFAIYCRDCQAVAEQRRGVLVGSIA